MDRDLAPGDRDFDAVDETHAVSARCVRAPPRAPQSSSWSVSASTITPFAAARRTSSAGASRPSEVVEWQWRSKLPACDCARIAVKFTTPASARSDANSALRTARNASISRREPLPAGRGGACGRRRQSYARHELRKHALSRLVRPASRRMRAMSVCDSAPSTQSTGAVDIAPAGHRLPRSGTSTGLTQLVRRIAPQRDAAVCRRHAPVPRQKQRAVARQARIALLQPRRELREIRVIAKPRRFGELRPAIRA